MKENYWTCYWSRCCVVWKECVIIWRECIQMRASVCITEEVCIGKMWNTDVKLDTQTQTKPWPLLYSTAQLLTLFLLSCASLHGHTVFIVFMRNSIMAVYAAKPPKTHQDHVYRYTLSNHCCIYYIRVYVYRKHTLSLLYSQMFHNHRLYILLQAVVIVIVLLMSTAFYWNIHQSPEETAKVVSDVSVHVHDFK